MSVIQLTPISRFRFFSFSRKKKRRRRLACLPAWLICSCCMCFTILAVAIGLAIFFALRKYFYCYFCQEVASKKQKIINNLI